MKAISILPSAINALNRLPASERQKILSKIKRYAETGSGKVTRLQGRPEFRLRQGDYRVLFRDGPDEVTVVAIGHRSTIYD